MAERTERDTRESSRRGDDTPGDTGGEARDGGRLDGLDLVVAVLAALVAFGGYLATLYPGLHDVGDAAKFSFVGRVLGTPHPPGYPLYVMVSHAFSYVPWGTLAYRMNALSAVFAAVTVGLCYLLTRRLGPGRMVAVSVSLGLAFGSAFWSRSLYAKGYTLNAALVTAGVLALVHWERTRRARDFYVAAGIFALSLGNHLIVIALLPVLVLFPLLTDPRATLRPRTVATVLLLVALGLSQYGLIVVRTRQAAPYLEAKASNVTELWRVMTARRFDHEIGAFSRGALLDERIPHIAGMVGRELGPVGLPLVVAGLAVLAVTRPRHALLFGVGAASVALFTANMGSQEDEGFLLPAFVLAWPAAGVGLARVAAWLRRPTRHLAGSLVVAVAVAVPSGQVLANYRANDHHADTADIEYFDALFAVLPDRVAIIEDEYRVNMMLLYKLLGEQAAGPRNIRMVRADREVIATLMRDGFEVLAFSEANATLREFGLRFAPFTPPPGYQAALASRPLYRVVAGPVCLDLGNRGWTDIGRALAPHGRVAIRIDNYRTFDSQVTIYTGTDARPSPALAGEGGAGSPVLAVDVFARGAADAGRLEAQLVADGATLPAGLREAPFVTRIDLRVNDKGAFFTTGLDVGAGVSGAAARALVDLDNPRRATVCAHGLADVTTWPEESDRLELPIGGGIVEFGPGWYAPERRPDGRQFRWTAEQATIVLTLPAPRTATLSIVAEPLNYPGRREGTVALVVNGERVGWRPLPAGSKRFTWEVARDRWRKGLNTISLEVTGATRPSDVGPSPDRRVLGLSVVQVELAAAPGHP